MPKPQPSVERWAACVTCWKPFVAAVATRLAIESVAQGKLSGRSFLLQECDGKLLSQMLNAEGEAFAKKCYEPYIKDYRQVLVRGLASDYLVEDNAANQLKIEAALDQRFEQWKRGPWWKFW